MTWSTGDSLGGGSRSWSGAAVALAGRPLGSSDDGNSDGPESGDGPGSNDGTSTDDGYVYAIDADGGSRQ